MQGDSDLVIESIKRFIFDVFYRSLIHLCLELIRYAHKIIEQKKNKNHIHYIQ